MREILVEKPISIPQVKEILEKIVATEKIDTEEPVAPASEEEAPVAAPEAEKTKKYFLKSTYEYATTFAKMDSHKAQTLIDNLMKVDAIANQGIDPGTKIDRGKSIAIQIVNIDPDTPEELALLFEKGTRRPSNEEIQSLLEKIRSFKEL